MSETTIVRFQGPTVRVQINRPEAGNSINTQLIDELHTTITRAERSDSVKVFILEGLPEVFCSGNDFDALAKAGEQQLSDRADVERFFDLLTRLGNCPLITIAVVRGRTQAGGVGIAAACDLVLAQPNATFALSEMLFELVPACILPFIARRIGHHRARRMALTTLPITAQKAVAWGLVDEADDDLERLLRLRVSRFTCLTAPAIARLKDYARKLDTITPQVRELAVDTITPLINAPDIREGIRRFIQEGEYPWQSRTSESPE